MNIKICLLLILIILTVCLSCDNSTETKPDFFDYQSEEIAFESEDLRLEGTLTLPTTTSKVSAIVIANGNLLDRDGIYSPVNTHPVYEMWANTIASHGIAVLRYDQRFITHTINLSEFTLSDRINDIIAAISYLKSRSEINTGKIFIVGHSQGGCIAPVAAQRENSVLGVGIINSDAIAIDTLIIERLKARGLPTSYISDILDKFELLRTNTFSPEWEYSNRGAIYWKEWIEYTEKADSITVSLGKPILIIQGSDDETYTPLTYQKNLSKWESISNQSSLIDLKIYEGVTHLVLKSGTQQTETQVLHDLITWIRQYDQLLE